MGVDYSAVFGIGVKIDNQYFENYREEDDDFVDKHGVMDSLLQNTSFTYGQSGDGSYTGRENEWYIFINEEDEQLWVDELDSLFNFLDKNNVPVEDSGIVGGLHMW